MRHYEFNKLIRSKLPERMILEGVKVDKQALSKDQFIDKLKHKLLEEATEVLEASDKEKITQELADVMEVILTLASSCEIEMSEIEQERIKKLEINGHFAAENYVNYIEVAEANTAVIEYLDNKDRPYKFVK